MKLFIVFVVCLSVFLTFGTDLAAQEVTIKGTVTSKEDGNTLPGVNVVVKGTTRGVTTDLNGLYTIAANPEDILIFSYIGFRSVEVSVGMQAKIDIVLMPDAQDLNELVVVGYGSRTRSDLIGAVSTLKPDEITSRPTSDIQGMLRGQVSGLYVSVGSARPGGNSNMVLRGINSLKGSVSPLYVVDGFPVSNINEMNVDDIETISVLKDASAQAIYGARASNGVILITTKRGADKKGKIDVNYNFYISSQNVKPLFEVFSPEEYIQIRREAFRGDKANESNNWTGNIDDSTMYMPDSIIFTPLELESMQNGQYVDWMDLAFKENALLVKNDLSISGGNEDTRYAISLGYYNQDGVRMSSDYRRYSGKLALDQNITKWLTVGMNVYYSDYIQHQENNSWTDFITFSPIAQLYDSTGKLNVYPLGDYKSVNPLYWEQTRSLTVKGNRGIYNGYMEVRPFKGFKYRLNAGMDNRERETDDFKSMADPSSVLGKGFAQANFYTDRDYVIENIFTYENKFSNSHRFNVTLLQSADQRVTTSTTSTANELGNDFFGINSLGSAVESSVARTQAEHSILSFMARIDYIIKDRYLFNFTIRADGSSVFGENNKWGYFPSGAFAWNMKNENFMKDVTWMDESKIRLSAGQIGNEAISPYGSLATANNAFYVSEGQPIIGYLPGSSLPNPDLKWETTTTYNLGYDFAFFKQRLTGALDFYKKITTDLLVDRYIPTSLGYSTMPDNLGEIQNTGFEISLTGYVISTNTFSWMIGGLFSLNRNKLTKGVLRDAETGEYIDDVANKWFIGEPVNVYYDYQFDGIWQISDSIAGSYMPDARPGDVKVVNTDGDSIITANDKIVIHRDPKWFATFSTGFDYKGIELSAEFYIVRGVTKSSPFMSDVNYGGSLQGYNNGVKREYWTPEDPSNTTFRPHETVTSEYRGALDYQDASYFRITNVTLAYTLPRDWTKAAKMDRVRIYFQGVNLLTITKYLSLSPEVNPDSYPETVNFTFGVNVNF